MYGDKTADLDKILRHQGQMETERHVFEEHWQEVAEFVLPRSSTFNRTWTQGSKVNHRQYDAFHSLALNRFAAAMEGGTIPRHTHWHHVTTYEEELDELDNVKAYREDLNRRLFRQRMAGAANFYSQAHEHFLSLGAFGTGVMWVDEATNKRGARYRNIHLGEVFISEDHHGTVTCVHRKYKPTVNQIIGAFGKDAPERVREAYDKGDYEHRFEILHCVYPRDGADYDPDRLDKHGMPIAEAYVFCEGKEVIREGGYYEMPYLVSRYVTTAREVYGRSPAMMVLPDIKMCNEITRVTIDAAALQLDPPMLMPHDDILGDFSLEMGSRNYGAVDDQGRQLVVPLVSDAKPQLGMEWLDRIHAQVDDAFLGVYFRVLLENPNMTATQALLLAQQQGQMAQPMVGRQQAEFLDPLIKREAGIMARQGRAPEPPNEVIEWMQQTGEPLGIRYESPLVRQARQEEAVGILRTMEQLTPAAQLDPSVFARFNWSKVSEKLADLNGVPQDVLYSQEEMAEKMAQDQQQQQAQLALQAAPVAADAAKSIAQAQALAGNQPAPLPGMVDGF